MSPDSTAPGLTFRQLHSSTEREFDALLRIYAEAHPPGELKPTSTLVQMIVPEAPQNLIGDNAYDSDRLDAELRQYGIELIAPHRGNRINTTQDLRRLRRYRRRWKVERLFAWLQNFRRLVVRYERYAENFLGMLYLGCCLILLRHEDVRKIVEI